MIRPNFVAPRGSASSTLSRRWWPSTLRPATSMPKDPGTRLLAQSTRTSPFGCTCTPPQERLLHASRASLLLPVGTLSAVTADPLRVSSRQRSSRAGGNQLCSSSASTSSSSSAATVASAAAAAAIAACSASALTNNEAGHKHVSKAEAELRALGNALQANHERQMVRMAKLLKSLEKLAAEREEEGENKTREEEDSAQKNAEKDSVSDPMSAGIHAAAAAVPRHYRVIHATEKDLDNLHNKSPEAVWGYIDALRDGAIFGREDVKRIARAASLALRKEPSLIDLSERCQDGELKTVTVVGDLHGHFSCSLLKVLDMLGGGGEGGKDGKIGTPWDGTGAVVFNGDFVDRGEHSLEVILSLLLLKLAYPNNVYLNRGNHEDSVLSTVYGYSEELQARYGHDKDHGDDVQDIWKEFGDVFAALPLAVRTNSAAIIHGGLPSHNFRLEQLASITSKDRFRVKTMMEPGADDETCKLIQNLAWSDPMPEDGVSPNEDRGCGMRFGPDVVRNFLSDHELRYLVRSHEPVDAGYELLECDENGMSAVTVFSATNYPSGAGYNYGAIVRLQSDGTAEYASFYDSHSGQNSAHEKMNHTFKAFAGVVARNRTVLENEFAYLAEKRANRLRLQSAFSPVQSTAAEKAAAADDIAAASLITPEQWADVMNYALEPVLPNVDWMSLQPYLAPGDLIDYKRFLNLHCNLVSPNKMEGRSAALIDDHTREVLLRNHEALLTVFKFLDFDHDGRIDRNEFCRGIAMLTRRNPDSALLLDTHALFDSLDTDGNGALDIDEFESAFQAVGTPYHVAVLMLFDKDKDGTVSRAEFQEGVRLLNARLPESEKKITDVDKLFDELDVNGDGELDFEEFDKFVRDYYPH